MTDVPYVELRCRTAFSFGDGTVTPERLVSHAAHLGYPGLGVADAADLGGVVRFIAAARREHITPIIGAELLVDGEPATFMARDGEGYRHLASLITRARSGTLRDWRDEEIPQPTDGTRLRDQRRYRSKATLAHPHPPRGHPSVSWAAVREHAAGLHALTGNANGPLAQAQRKDPSTAARLLAEWREAFDGHVSVEVQDHGAGWEEQALTAALVALAERHHVPWVVTHEPRYLGGPSWLLHDMLTALRAGVDLKTAEQRGILLPSGAWALERPAVMAARWRGREAGLHETLRLKESCEASLAWVRPPMPKFPVPSGYADDNAFFVDCVRAGAHERWTKLTPEQDRQLEHEIRVITKLDFAGFFLVMWDAVRYAASRGILAQGRGSAANSAVAYCLGITAVDPVKHGLLFERFLSEARTDGHTEAPDIDVDFEADRREEVLTYVYGKYQRSHAAITAVVQTYQAPNAILDCMRALGYPAELAIRLSKRLHHADIPYAVERLRGGLAAAQGLNLDTPAGRALLTALPACEGLPRLRSTHPGGFVLSSAPLGDYLPVEPTAMGRTVVQFDKDDLDTLGVPKFDFLGLGALAAVRGAFDLIERRTGERPAMYSLPQDDEATFLMIAHGETLGTFQIESRAQIASIVHTKPDRLYDIVVQVALIRPGPIQAKFVHPYTRRRRGEEPVTYPDPRLEPILKRTYGIPIFQEQAMAIAMALGGYSAADADELRRCMGFERKRARLMEALTRLRNAMIAHGTAVDVAEQIAQDLTSFANYGFPESHAWSFALIGYATGWLKCHHGPAFYAALLNAQPMGFYSPATLVHEARQRGVIVRPPCVLASAWDCTLEDGPDETPAVRIGLRYVQGLSEKIGDTLVAERRRGVFTSIEDVVRRVPLTAGDAIRLGQSGVFTLWERDRRRAAWIAVGAASDTLPLAPGRRAGETYELRPLGRSDQILLDYETLGLSTRGHPMARYRKWLRAKGVLSSRELRDARQGSTVTTAGLVTVRQRPATAKGTVFLLLEDEEGSSNVIVNRQLMERHAETVQFSTFLIVEGKLEREESLVNVVGRKFRTLRERGDRAGVAYRSHDFR